MIGEPPDEGTTARAFRARDGRLLGGVCAGLAPVRGWGAGRLRLAFALTALCGGIGIAAYLACWLVIPRADAAGQPERASGAVVLAAAAAGFVALALLALLGTLATVFGFGGIVLAVAAAIFAASLLARGGRRAGLGLLPVAALTLPAVAVALSPVRLTFQSGASVVSPRTAAAASRAVYRSGFGTLLIDLRHTQLPTTGTVPLRIAAGLRRTIVALPSNRCVQVTVRYAVHPFADRFAALLTGYSTPPLSGLVLFGHLYGNSSDRAPHGVVGHRGKRSGPTLAIDFSSQGGSLFVRDYPAGISPDTNPNWPGFPVTPEPRPYLKGEQRRVIPGMLRAWRRRRAVELADQRYVDAHVAGPCVPRGRS